VERRITVRREQATEQDGWVEAGARIELPRGESRRLWFRARLPEGWTLSPSSDPFVLIPLYEAMRRVVPLHVEGDVSPSLLANLEEFQRFVSCWHPHRFRPVEIVAEREREQPPGHEGALVAFSSGVDSAFTLYRHATGQAGRQTQSIRAALMAHGFDIPVGEEAGFRKAADRAEAMVATLGVPLLRVVSNIREVEHAWDDAVGPAIASCFHLLQPNARAGLVPASLPYELQVIWGSYPESDPLLSSDSLRIIHDGAGFSRPEKAATLGRWPAALEGLRVCWEGAQRDANCCRCEKCIRTILTFRAVGLGLPPCFPHDVTEEQLRSLRLTRLGRLELRQVLDVLDGREAQEPWMRTLRQVYYRDRRRLYARQVVRHLRRRLPGA
jgi:hypothetical protein